MAANRHVELAKEAVGNGVDRHLMAMKLVATEEDTVHDIALFNNEMYSYSSNFLISSSNVTSPELSILALAQQVIRAIVCWLPNFRRQDTDLYNKLP